MEACDDSDCIEAYHRHAVTAGLLPRALREECMFLAEDKTPHVVKDRTQGGRIRGLTKGFLRLAV